MSFNHTFFWPKGPSEVILTGTFDNWTGSLPLVKTSKGDFEITLPLKQEDDDKVLFKFIVDGNWTTSKDYETSNEDGNENNVLYLKNLSQAEGSKKGSGSKIPEAGGLATASVPAAAAAAAAAAGSSSKSTGKENSKEYKPTVEPSQEGKHSTIAGEPGVAIPSNPHEIKEFGEVRDVDAKALNEKLNKEDEEKIYKTQVLPSQEGQQSNVAGEPGVAIPKDAQNVKEFSEVRDVDAKDLNEKLGSEEGTGALATESTTSSEKKTKKVPVKKLIRRNKKTGEEVVVSSEPATNGGNFTEGEKTLDPKKTITGETNGKTETTQDTAKTTEDKPKTSATGASTTAAKPKPKPKPAVSAAEKKEEDKKKKSSVFKKFKKFFD